jgi:tRNA-binding EMAP/Myf-like protein
MSWLREYVDLPVEVSARDVAARLIRAGLEVETVDEAGADVTGPLVIGRVLEFTEETHKNGKTIRWCSVDVGPEHNADRSGEGAASPSRGIICGARNFEVGDLVVVCLPGAVLPGGFAITARKTYGHVSDGMICSERELGLGDDHAGIMVLDPDAGTPGDDAAPVLHLRDDVLDIAVTPDRGYCLSVRGVAREAATAYGVEFRDPGDPSKAAGLVESLHGVAGIGERGTSESAGEERSQSPERSQLPVTPSPQCALWNCAFLLRRRSNRHCWTCRGICPSRNGRSGIWSRCLAGSHAMSSASPGWVGGSTR